MKVFGPGMNGSVVWTLISESRGVIVALGPFTKSKKKLHVHRTYAFTQFSAMDHFVAADHGHFYELIGYDG